MSRPSRVIDQAVNGAETNGFYANVNLHWVHGFGELPMIDVSIVGTLDPTNASPPAPKRPHDWFEPAFTYYVVTRGPPGPMELKDATGHAVSGVNQGTVSAERFPATLRLSKLREQQVARGMPGSLKMPEPLMDRSTALPLLRLQDLFVVKEPGSYELTVLPKIYKKSETDGDLLQRVDLSPVTVSFRYEPPP